MLSTDANPILSFVHSHENVTYTISIKKATMSDAVRLSKIASDIEIAKNVGDTFPHPYTLQDAEWWIATGSQKENSRIYGIYIDDIYAGNIGREQNQTGRVFHNIDLGYRLGRAYWGKGIMTNIVQHAITHIFIKIPSCHRIYAKVYSRNQGSRRVLEKSGLTLESHRKESIYIEGERHDEYEYAILRKTL